MNFTKLKKKSFDAFLIIFTVSILVRKKEKKTSLIKIVQNSSSTKSKRTPTIKTKKKNKKNKKKVVENDSIGYGTV